MAQLHLHISAAALGDGTYRVTIEDRHTGARQTIEPVPARSSEDSVQRVLGTIMRKLPAGSRVTGYNADCDKLADLED